MLKRFDIDITVSNREGVRKKSHRKFRSPMGYKRVIMFQTKSYIML